MRACLVRVVASAIAAIVGAASASYLARDVWYGLLAAIDASQRHHDTAMRALASARPPRLLSPFVLAELDYLLANRGGSRAQLALL